MKQIKKFGVLKTAKITSIMYLIGSAVFCVPLGLIMFALRGSLTASPVTSTGREPSALFILLFPLIYFVIGFLLCSVMCFLYNITAPRVGGIEIELTEEQ